MNDCIFCKIAAGTIPATEVYRDDDFVAFMDINPINKGHVLLIPIMHADRLTDLPGDILSKELPLAARIASAVLKSTGMPDFNLMNANGPAAGQEVFHHHLHIIPRRPGDHMKMKIEHETYGEGESGALATVIRSHMSDKP
jgi:histidine triad (HIT) family protein